MSKNILFQLTKESIQPKQTFNLAEKINMSRVPLGNKPPSRRCIKSPVSLKSHDFEIREYVVKMRPNTATSLSDKIYAFDLDWTLIRTKSGKTFSTHHSDWKWCFDSVIERLKSVNGHTIVIFTNQRAVLADTTESKSLFLFLMKLKAVLTTLDENGMSNVWVYASTGQSAASKKRGVSPTEFKKYRKPDVGMFEELEKDYEAIKGAKLKKENVVFVGDAAGRINDYSDCDIEFANNCGIEFKVPEDFFQ